MREKRDDGTDAREKDEKKKRLDLSVAQVSGSAVAAVVAAKLASNLGVYGTILGAGVISVVATCGGSVLQFFFRRTGEQLREATVQATKPKGRQVPLPDRTQVLGTVSAPPPGDGTYGEATTHGTRIRGRRRSLVAAALVFVVAMGGITTYELISGQDFSGTEGTTTFRSAVTGGEDNRGGQKPSSPGDAPAPSRTPGRERPAQNGDHGSASPGTGTTPDPGRDATGTPDPTPTPSASDGGTPEPEPTPSTGTPTAPTAPAPDASPAEGSAVAE
ncbi:hypothetical protein AB0C77_15875 [Streptomyces sp. NPDC048629]